MNLAARRLRSEASDVVSYYGEPSGKRGRGGWVAVLVVLLLVTAFLVYPTPVTSPGAAAERATNLLAGLSSALGGGPGGASSTGPNSATSSVVTGTASAASGSATASTSTLSGSGRVLDPTITNGKVNISYPGDYQALANFSLGLVNADRATFGLAPLALSQEPSGQQHADSMLYFDYFSHWDPQGYKPYMRYTLLGGTAAVSENVALNHCTPFPTNATAVPVARCTLATEENAIRDSEYQMMYNDVQCCDNGHREDILNPVHNLVSVGVAVDTATYTVYFVEDFESSHVQLSQPILSGNDTISFVGTTSSNLSGLQVFVFYDPVPGPMTTTQLDSTGAYDVGTFVGGVIPKCGIVCGSYQNATTLQAATWRVGQGKVDISFSLDEFVSASGPGVYTVYLVFGSSTNDAAITYSAFVNG